MFQMDLFEDEDQYPNNNFILPSISQAVITFAKNLNCIWVGAIKLSPIIEAKEWDCHNNCVRYEEEYGWKRVIGYYILECTITSKLVAIMHSVIERNNQLVDITPFSDNRDINIFARLPNDYIIDYSKQEIWSP